MFLLQPLRGGAPQYLAIDGSVGEQASCQPTRGGTVGHDWGAAKTGLNHALEFVRKAFGGPVN